jgi:hypothetical protein
MKNLNPETGMDDFGTILRRKIQIIMSKFASRFGFRKFDRQDFKVERLEITIPQLPLPFQNYRILHISDIHYDQWISLDRLIGIVGLVNENSPDLIAITGDFVSYLVNDRIEDDMITQLKRLKANDAIVAVLGNHDHWSGAERVRRILRESNIRDISNDTYTIQKQGANLNMAGIDSAWVKKDRLDIVLKKIPLDGPAILLAHEPDLAVKSAATKRFSLQLSGHSHGGQLIIPGVGTPFRGPLFRKYPHGKYTVGDMWQYTSRGLGTNGYWIRINCPPEIAVINLI